MQPRGIATVSNSSTKYLTKAQNSVNGNRNLDQSHKVHIINQAIYSEPLTTVNNDAALQCNNHSPVTVNHSSVLTVLYFIYKYTKPGITEIHIYSIMSTNHCKIEENVQFDERARRSLVLKTDADCWQQAAFLLAFLIVREVIKDGWCVAVVVNHVKHEDAFVWRNFLRVAGVGHWLVLVVLQPDVTQLAVRNVLDVDPADSELALPLVVLCPDAGRRLEVDGWRHLRNAAEVSTAVDAEEEVDLPGTLSLTVRCVQSLVAILRAAPDAVLYRPMNVLLRVALDHKKPCRWWSDVELFRVVVVLCLKLLYNGACLWLTQRHPVESVYSVRQLWPIVHSRIPCWAVPWMDFASRRINPNISWHFSALRHPSWLHLVWYNGPRLRLGSRHGRRQLSNWHGLHGIIESTDLSSHIATSGINVTIGIWLDGIVTIWCIDTSSCNITHSKPPAAIVSYIRQPAVARAIIHPGRQIWCIVKVWIDWRPHVCICRHIRCIIVAGHINGILRISSKLLLWLYKHINIPKTLNARLVIYETDGR